MTKNASRALLQRLKSELEKSADPQFLKKTQRYFKSGERRAFGVRTSLVRTLSAREYKKLRELRKDELFAICDALVSDGSAECRLIGFDWAARRSREFSARDIARFESWVKNHLDDWSDCDDLCVHALGQHVIMFPCEPRLRRWATAKHWVVRRAAAVALIPSVKQGRALTTAFAICRALFHDPHDLVQKGYGWLLKETSQHFPSEVLHFIDQYGASMSRTALRYALERFPPDVRRAKLDATRIKIRTTLMER